MVIESRVEHPLLPLRVIADRTRGGSYLVIGIAGIAMFGVFLFLTYYLQQTKGFTPIQTGPRVPADAGGDHRHRDLGEHQVPRQGRPEAAADARHLARRDRDAVVRADHPDSSYVGHILPGLVVMGVGMGNIFAPAIASATYGVDPGDTGVASAMVNTMQQVGGSIGTALLSSIFASSVANYAAGAQPSPQLRSEAAVHGYTVAFYVSAGVFAFGTLVVALVMRSVRVAHPAGQPAAAHA